VRKCKAHNDARTYQWCRTAPDLSTYDEWINASGDIHQAINEEAWAQERTGRLHHAHCRFEIVRTAVLAGVALLGCAQTGSYAPNSVTASYRLDNFSKSNLQIVVRDLRAERSNSS
jgi:hypothetical protein